MVNGAAGRKKKKDNGKNPVAMTNCNIVVCNLVPPQIYTTGDDVVIVQTSTTPEGDPGRPAKRLKTETEAEDTALTGVQ